MNNPLLVWSLIGAVCVALLGVALYYEYVVGALPCLQCVQIRLWVTAILAISVVGAVFHRHNRVQLGCWVGFLLSAIALTERSWRLLATEYGLIIGECGVPTNPGLPAWFPLHEWFPALFRPETTCGAPLEMLFGITMAEATLAFSLVFTVGAFTGLVVFGFVKKPCS